MPISVAEVSAMMDTMYRHRAPSLPPRALAEVFDRLVWCLDDNGAAIVAVSEDWLGSDERGRVEVALMMEEVVPFADVGELQRVCDLISVKWRDLEPQCRRMIERARRGRSSPEELK